MAAIGNDGVTRQVTDALARVRMPVFHADIVAKQTSGKLTIHAVLNELQRRVKAGELRAAGVAKSGARLFERVRRRSKQVRGSSASEACASSSVSSITALPAAAATVAATVSSSPPVHAIAERDHDSVSWMGFDEPAGKEDPSTSATAFDPAVDFI